MTRKSPRTKAKINYKEEEDIDDQVETSPSKKQRTTKKVKAIVTDIEGTTTPITFVKDTLFPFVLENLENFLESSWSNTDVQAAIESLFELSLKDKANGFKDVVEIVDGSHSKEDQIASIAKNIKWQMSLDRKVGPLKQFQGLMWDNAYKSGQIKGVVYEDVLAALEYWKSKKVPVYIYSSGSIFAQKLLFGFSEHGDLLPLLAGHFDTTIGPKVEPKSYANIAESITIQPANILFLSDNILECNAAKEAGFQVLNLLRPGNEPIPDLGDVKQIKSFETLHDL